MTDRYHLAQHGRNWQVIARKSAGAATAVARVDAAGGPYSAQQYERRYHWSPLSNSVETIVVTKGVVKHG